MLLEEVAVWGYSFYCVGEGGGLEEKGRSSIVDTRENLRVEETGV